MLSNVFFFEIELFSVKKRDCLKSKESFQNKFQISNHLSILLFKQFVSWNVIFSKSFFCRFKHFKIEEGRKITE